MSLWRLRGRRVMGLGRLLVAIALLGLLWVVTVTQVDRANGNGERQRVQDRLPIARAFASSVNDIFSSARVEANAIAVTLARSPDRPQTAVDIYMAGPRTFGRGALVVNSDFKVIAASAPLLALRNRVLPPCHRGEQTTGLTQADLAPPTGPRLVGRVFDGPGNCAPTVAAVAEAGTTAVVVLGDPADLQRAISLAARIDNRVFLLSPAHRAITPDAPDGPTPQYVQSFVDAGGSRGPNARRYAGPGGSAQVIGALVPVGEAAGWTLVLEEDAAVFAASIPRRPTIVVGALLTGAFAAVLLLLTLFDLRRQRAHRRSEVAKHAFFSIVGHELRTPLTVLKGFTETLIDRWDILDDDGRRMMIENLAPQALRLNRVVERVLLASELQSETYARPVCRPVPVAAHLERVARQFRPLAPLHTFVVEVEPDVANVQADPHALDQVLDQLVDNAVRYSPAGGTITLAAQTSRRGVTVTVDDEGVGLPSDHRRVFEAFVQGESVDRRVHDEGGVGVGLFIAKSLLKQMGGRVDAKRREHGSRFVVTLRPAGAARQVSSPSVARP